MFKNEDDFKKIVSRLNIDNKPNPVHRENLRRQMLSAFNEGQQPKSIWQSIIKSPITKLAAAAVIIIAIGLFLVHQGPSEPVETTKAAKVAKSPAEMMTLASLTFAYRQGGIEALQRHLEMISEMKGSRQRQSITLSDILVELNGNGHERKKL